MTVTAVLIDDEHKSLAILKNKLERLCPNVNIVGETQDPEEGIELINTLKPQLVFLDIAMPGMNGFEVLQKIQEPQFEVIFVTAFDNYGIEAIKHCAIGYVVKPIDSQDLIQAVSIATQNITDKTALQKNKQLIENLGIQSFQQKKIVIPSQDGLEFVKIEDIIHCQGTDGYTKIYFQNDKPIMSSYSIGHFLKLLKHKDFYLIHKSHLINVNYILKYLNEGYVVLQDNHKLPVSRNKRTDFLNMIRNV
ncbi:Transcriptional regulatory protein YehT [Kordia antarctica]|uniref:Transcriptional regulatory protein YehT n=1 Tax=Kordia antarctica TaxID=1218801 RepID=A0A7L4ZLB3_9FLAO|nr:LytTR family DNA-binding domain-containing protein [Kordia antarctica]QHI37508.1 Transcriptional regulatory protein YehT [Kordia antarctica]